MKVCIVIQSDAFRTSAGMRIRYDRFREGLADPAVSLDTLTCDELVAAKTLDHDVYIFCKTFDTTALLAARRVRAAGKVVGQDLFDDYFSQYDDPRLERFREWMRDMAPLTHFAICSTPRMVEVMRPYMPYIRIVSIDDPIIGFDPSAVAARADAKTARARETRTLDVAWFGIGDNPYFPVGLADLAACEPELARFERLGWKVSLRIVTNMRAFEAGATELLRRLSVDHEVVEWTEDAEQDALERATVAILPVSGQSFSRAKSMNRAVTALSGGCQVLSLGFPLYERLDDFIYRSADELIDDIERDDCRVSTRRIAALTAILATLANPFEAAASFVRESRTAMRTAPRETSVPLLCLIHGRTTTIGSHKLVSALRGLSVGTMYSKAAWNFQVRFDVVANRLAMRVNMALARRFNLPLRDDSAAVRIGDLEFVEIDVAALGMAPLAVYLPKDPTPLQDLALYEDVMRFAQSCCLAAFAPAEVLLSDSSPLHRRPPVTMRDADTTDTAENASDKQSSIEPKPAGAAPDHPPAPAAAAAKRSPSPSPPVRRARFPIATKAQQRRRTLAMIEESVWFDHAWYLATYPDIAASGNDPARHYLELGWREGRDPGPHFSTKLYLKTHPDVASQDINPLLHYLEHGEAEGRLVSGSLARASRKTGAIVECD